MIRHFFTVDVEEYFQVVALAPYAPMSRWASFESRVEASVDRLLQLMGDHQARGTFFTVGWVAERHPELMRRIVAAGHEVASHTYDHVRVTHQTPEAFRVSVRKAKRIIEDVTGSEVIGFRAPSFSIGRGTEWALDVLIEEGHRYDSSIFPIRRPDYGVPGAPRDPYWMERPAGRIAEFPLMTLRAFGMTWPAAGGGYLRHFPSGVVHAAMRQSAARGRPGMFYIHPWEWDPEQPRFDVPWVTRQRHYGGLSRVFERIEALVRAFPFTAIREQLTTVLPA